MPDDPTAPALTVRHPLAGVKPGTPHAPGTRTRNSVSTTDDASKESSDDFVDPDERPSRLDAWWAHVLRTPERFQLWFWGAPIVVTVIAAVLRIWNLGDPHSLVFDETYYVKDSWSLWHLGYEGTWPANSDGAWNSGNVSGFNATGSYVVHPPLGKWLIGLPMVIFGGANSTAWRLMVALVGIAAVFLLMMIARRLFRSTLLAAIAGLLLAIDGNAIVMSRVGLLDNIAMFFGLLGFWFILLDRSRARRTLESWITDWTERGEELLVGPMIWRRPWILAAGAAFGAMSAVKWSGVYFLAGYGIYLIVVEALLRRRLGFVYWSTGAIKQIVPTFLLLVPIALATYLASWTGWFVTSGGTYRNWAAEHPTNGIWASLPDVVRSFWQYHVDTLRFHDTLSSSHSYQANPLGWLFMNHPTNMYQNATDGCGSQCTESIYGIGNVLVWYGALIAMIYLVVRLILRREWVVGLILSGMAVSYLPWLMYLRRTVFEFYTIVFEPYSILALTFCLGLLLADRTAPAWRRVRGVVLVATFLGLAVAVSIMFYPMWSSLPIPSWYRSFLLSWWPGWSSFSPNEWAWLKEFGIG